MNARKIRIQSAGIGLLIFGVLMVQYYFTLAPTVLHIDCGELAAAQYSLGVTHPTGYPLFTILGYLFLKIPLFERIIVQANFLSALWTATGVGVLSSSLFLFLQNGATQNRKAFGENPTILNSVVISIVAGLIFGSTLTVWAQATSLEVYSLHLLLLAISLLFLFLAWQKNRVWDWVALAMVLGLGFSNHMTTLMIVPTVGFLYFHKNGINHKAFKSLLIPAFAGLSVLILLYGFLIWRAGMNPVISWGNLHDWTSLKRHITGHQYQNWIFAGSKVAAKNLGKFLKALPFEWAFLGPVLMIFGIKKAFQYNRPWAWALTIGLVFNIFYVTQYDIKDLEPYFLLSMVVLAFYLAFGLLTILSKLKKPIAHIGITGFAILVMAINWKQSDQSRTTFFESYSKAILQSVEPNALILSQQWDFLITPYYYFSVAEKQFTNLLVVDKELMRRSWYINGQLPIFQPSIFVGSETERKIFLTELAPFENGESYDGNRIEEAYQNLIGKMLTEQYKIRPVYLTLEYVQSQEVRLPSGFTLIPMGLVMKLERANHQYQPCNLPLLTIQFPENWTKKGPNLYYSSFIKEKWNLGCELRSRYENQFGKHIEAQKWRIAQWE